MQIDGFFNGMGLNTQNSKWKKTHLNTQFKENMIFVNQNLGIQPKLIRQITIFYFILFYFILFYFYLFLFIFIIIIIIIIIIIYLFFNIFLFIFIYFFYFFIYEDICIFIILLNKKISKNEVIHRKTIYTFILISSFYL